jgi:hypothetical protein
VKTRIDEEPVMRRVHGFLMSLIVVLLLSVALLSTQPIGASSPLLQATSTPTPEPQFFRTVEVLSKAVANRPANIRTEPSQTSEIIRQASAGNKFQIRQNVEWVEAEGYTWVPIVASSQHAWVALSL